MVVNNLCLAIFTEVGGVHYLLSAVFATQCSTLWNFIFTEIWVFRRRTSDSLSGRVIRFFLMNNGALLVRGPLLTILVSLLGVHYILANLATLLLIALIRFFLSDKWIWPSDKAIDQKEIYYYDLHHIIRIESCIQLPELAHFQVPGLSIPADIRLKSERRKKPRLSKRGIYYHDGVPRMGFEISINLGDQTDIFVSDLIRNSPHVLYTNVFEPVLRWVFVRKGYALIHGAAIVQNGFGSLVTAQTDTGKTSTILRIIQETKGSFISDDMTILSREGVFLNYPKPLTISFHTLRALEGCNLTLLERLKLQVQSRVHSRSGRKFALWLVGLGLPVATINAVTQILIPPPKYRIDRLIPDVKIAESGLLTHIFQIERGDVLQEKIELEDVVSILQRNAEDAYGFPPYPEIAGALRIWQGEDLRNQEKQIIQEAVKGCQAWRVRNPSYDWWKLLPKLVANESEIDE